MKKYIDELEWFPFVGGCFLVVFITMCALATIILFARGDDTKARFYIIESSKAGAVIKDRQTGRLYLRTSTGVIEVEKGGR